MILTRRRLIALAVAPVVVPFPALANEPASYCADAEEAAMLALVNGLRRSLGVPELRLSQTLGAAAEHHSADMADKSYFSHTLKDGTTWSKNMTAHGYGYTTYRGENLAAGRSDAAGTFATWKNSPGHYANMANKNYRAIGIGRAYGPNSTYKWYWTQVFGGVFDVAACVSTAAPMTLAAASGAEVAAPDLIAAVSEDPHGEALPDTGSGPGSY